jgi:16S rRNA (uracil1498-N3)-methyltransferase
MQLFYCPNISQGEVSMPEDEARHCVQVLRHRVGDRIHVVDGTGGRYEAEITAAGKRGCRVMPVSGHQQELAGRVRLHMAVAPTKQIDRFEWFLEKSTEIGVDAITPILCHRSERQLIREDRCVRVLISAMKQSLRAHLPEFRPMVRVEDFLSNPQLEDFAGRFIATCEDIPKSPLSAVVPGSGNVLVMIGPEGDFEGFELEKAALAGFRPVSLGESRLRTETAGIVACHTVNLMGQLHVG